MTKTYPFLTTSTGFLSFLTAGILTGLISLRTIEGLMLILGLPIGSLLMLFMLRKLSKEKLLVIIILSTAGGFAGFLGGFLIAELLHGILGLLIPSLRNLDQMEVQILPNIVVLLVADTIYGTLIGHLLYGQKAIKPFAFISAAASIPFGILLSMPIHIAWINFDQNLLFSLISFGTTTGLSIELYSLFQLKNNA